MSSTSLDDAVALMRGVVDDLLSATLTSVDAPALVSALAELEVQRRRLDAVDVRLIAEIDDRRIAGDYGRSTTADLLARRLRVSPGEARARVDRGRDLGPRRELNGSPLPPILSATSAALHDGEISVPHANVISKALDALPAHLAVEASGPAEAFLVEAARHEDPAALRRNAELLLQRLDPDGREPRDEDVERRRGFTLRRRADGSSVPVGLLTAETTATWQTILDALSAPTNTAGDVDDRTPAQRREDALRDAGLRLLRSGSLPESGGVPVTVLVTTTADDLATHAAGGAGIARTAHGELIGLRRLLSLTDPEIRYTTLTITGELLHHGRAKRIATAAQRRALASRDGGCCFPACTRPAAWAEAHHVVAWLNGGPTDVDNLCLVCPFHHRLLDRGDWQVTMIDGRPHWLPPPWIDPERRPQLNTANHLPEIDFGDWLDIESPDTG